jgi:hypothetical protein
MTQDAEYGYFPHSYFGETYFPAVWFAPAMVEIDEDRTIWGGHQPMPFSRKRKNDDDEILDLVAMLLPFLDKLNSARGLT